MTNDVEAPTPALGLDKAALDAVHRAVATAINAVIGTPARDVLAWYADELTAAGGGTATATDRLIAIFSILTGLGMRESSGRLCVGADTPKSRGEPTTPENAEAGLFHVSWDSINGDADRQALFDAFKHRTDPKDIFGKGVTCSGADLDIHGNGEQAEFQTAMKDAPLFAALYAARIGWGRFLLSVSRRLSRIRPASGRALSRWRPSSRVPSSSLPQDRCSDATIPATVGEGTARGHETVVRIQPERSTGDLQDGQDRYRPSGGPFNPLGSRRADPSASSARRRVRSPARCSRDRR